MNTEWCGHKPRNAWIQQEKEWSFPWDLQKEDGPGRHLDLIIVNFRTVKEYISIILSFEATKFEAMCMAAVGNQYIPSLRHCVLSTLGLGFGYRWKACVSPPAPFMYGDPNPQCGDWTFGRCWGYEGGLIMQGCMHLWDPRKPPCLFCHVGLQRRQPCMDQAVALPRN